MTKSKLNLIVDALLLLCLAAVAGIGLLMKYVLVPGFRRWEIYGRNVELLFRGMDRHEWGAVHLVLGCVFAGLLVLHVALHWQRIVGIYCRLIPGRALRYVTAAILVGLVLLLLSFWVLVRPEVREAGRGRPRGGRRHEGPTRRTQEHRSRGRFAASTPQGERRWQTTGREEDSWERRGWQSPPEPRRLRRRRRAPTTRPRQDGSESSPSAVARGRARPPRPL